jgi:sugar phosphate permease
MWRWRILISTYMAYMGYYLTRKVFTICKTSIVAEFHWELADTAHIWTAFLVAYMLGQFISSFIGRKWGPRILILGGLGISMICNIIFGFANSYKTLLVFMFFNGLAQAAGWPGCVGGVSEWLRKQERGTIMGVWSTNHLIGNVVVKWVGGYVLGLVLLLGGYLLGAAGWRWSFWTCTALASGTWWLAYAWQRNRPEDAGLPPIVEEESHDIRTVRASEEDHLTFSQYARLALHPVVLAMGASYFCIKFLRYELDSWLPAFLNVQGLQVDSASYYSMIFDLTGVAGAILAGLALDRWFKGNWALVCFLMGLGAIGGYVSVLYMGVNPYAIAVCFGLVGFMVYGPDTILSGAAAVQVAGEKNGVAVAGIVNGIASVGPVVQEQVVGLLVRGHVHQGIRNANILTLSMSVFFTLLMILVMYRVHQAHQANHTADGDRR